MTSDQNPFEKDNVDINHRQPFLGQGCFRPNASSNFREFSKYLRWIVSEQERKVKSNKVHKQICALVV